MWAEIETRRRPSGILQVVQSRGILLARVPARGLANVAPDRVPAAAHPEELEARCIVGPQNPIEVILRSRNKWRECRLDCTTPTTAKLPGNAREIGSRLPPSPATRLEPTQQPQTATFPDRETKEKTRSTSPSSSRPGSEVPTQRARVGLWSRPGSTPALFPKGIRHPLNP